MQALDDTVSFVSFYFFGPDGELLEFTEQPRGPIDPQREILHAPIAVHPPPEPP